MSNKATESDKLRCSQVVFKTWRWSIPLFLVCAGVVFIFVIVPLVESWPLLARRLAVTFVAFVAITALIETMIPGLNWAFLASRREEALRSNLDMGLTSHLHAKLTGWIERIVFISAAVLLTKPPKALEPPDMSNLGNLLIVGGGWIALKSVVGWQRFSDPNAFVRARSHTSNLASLVSIASAILIGVTWWLIK